MLFDRKTYHARNDSFYVFMLDISTANCLDVIGERCYKNDKKTRKNMYGFNQSFLFYLTKVKRNIFFENQIVLWYYSHLSQGFSLQFIISQDLFRTFAWFIVLINLFSSSGDL